ncbi:MAG: hypothetical protein CMJ90_12740 [Planctomycetes bacterium]|nr:hypothetical protein [Planctomycetota bacterium]
MDLGRVAPLAVVLIVALAGGVAFWLTREPPAVDLPALDLSGAAPGVSEAVAAAQKSLQEDPEAGERWGRIGAVLDINGLQTEAIPYYRAAIERDPDWRWPYFLGICLRITDLGAAAEQFKAAERRNPDHLGLLISCGRALDQLDQSEDARERFERALKQDPQCAPALEGLAGVALRADKVDEARRLMERATKAAPRYAPAWRLLAEARDRAGDAEGGRTARDAAARGSDTMPVADAERTALARDEGVLEVHRLSREQGYVGTGRPRSGIKEWQDHLAFDPESTIAHQRLSKLYLGSGDEARAREHLQRAIDLAPKSPDPHITYGVALTDRGRFDDAEAAFRSALAKDSEAHAARVRLGSLLCATGRLDEGVRLLTAAVTHDPNDPDALYNLGAAQLEGGVAGHAAQTLSSLAEIYPQHELVWDLWAISLQKVGKESEARDVLRKGLDKAPGNIRTVNRLAWLLATARDDAVRDGAHALNAAKRLADPRNAPPSAAVLDTLAAAYAETGDFQQAIATAKMAIEMANSPPSGRPDAKLAGRIRDRLETCYKAQRPWRGLP